MYLNSISIVLYQKESFKESMKLKLNKVLSKWVATVWPLTIDLLYLVNVLESLFWEDVTLFHKATDTR